MKKKTKKVNAAILIIGNEILSGRTQDKNISFISNWLNSKCGIAVKEVRIIPDEQKIIIENILLLSKKFNSSSTGRKSSHWIGNHNGSFVGHKPFIQKT